MALRPGICTAFTTQVFETLKEGGVATVSDFITIDPEKLSQDLKLAYKDICSIRRVLLAEHSAFPVSGATLYQDALASLSILPTGCESLDSLLDGGIYTGELTEVASDSGCGKTKLFLQSVAATVSTANHSTFFIDSGGSFDVRTVTQALVHSAGHERKSETEMKCLFQQIQVVQAFDIFELFSTLYSLRDSLTLKNQVSFFENLKLIVIDNIASLVNPLMGEDFAYSQGLICRLGLTLKEIATSFSVAVLVSNNMVSSFKSRERKAGLGRAWSHVPQTRIMLYRVDDKEMDRKGRRKAVLVKSGRQATPLSSIISLDINKMDNLNAPS